MYRISFSCVVDEDRTIGLVFVLDQTCFGEGYFVIAKDGSLELVYDVN
jgi:hypothetical protein